ncbi:MAG: L,D-transpeptidase [Hyphomicrobiales bacterium]
MNRTILSALSLAVAATALATSAEATDNRYRSKPNIQVSQELKDPWLLQLRPSYRFGPGRQTLVSPEMRGAPDVRVRAPSGEPPLAPGRVRVRSSGGTDVSALSPRESVRAPASAPEPKKAKTAARQVDPEFLPTVVDYDGGQSPGTIVIDTGSRHLFLVEEGGTARRYGVGVGRPGFEWAGTHNITRKAEWPAWVPPPEMRERKPGLPVRMEGGPANPLGARAMYLGSTLYRIHGSNEPWSIGKAVSSGCIRMRNEDVMDLYDRVKVGTKVIVM